MIYESYRHLDLTIIVVITMIQQLVSLSLSLSVGSVISPATTLLLTPPPIPQEMLMLLYRELTILGLIAFAIFELEHALTSSADPTILAFENIHITLFVVALVYGLAVLGLIQFSLSLSRRLAVTEERYSQFPAYKQLKQREYDLAKQLGYDLTRRRRRHHRHHRSASQSSTHRHTPSWHSISLTRRISSSRVHESPPGRQETSASRRTTAGVIHLPPRHGQGLESRGPFASGSPADIANRTKHAWFGLPHPDASLTAWFRHPHLLIQFHKVSEQTRYIEQRYRFLLQNQLPESFSFATYLRKCKQHVFTELVEVPLGLWVLVAWLIVVDLILRGLWSGYQDFMGVEVAVLVFSGAVVVIVLASYLKMKHVHWCILHASLVDVTPVNEVALRNAEGWQDIVHPMSGSDSDADEAQRHAMALLRARQERQAARQRVRAQRELFWFGKPILLLRAMQSAVFVLALAVALTSIGFDSLRGSPLDFALVFGALFIAFFTLIGLARKIVPLYVQAVHSGDLVVRSLLIESIEKQLRLRRAQLVAAALKERKAVFRAAHGRPSCREHTQRVLWNPMVFTLVSVLVLLDALCIGLLLSDTVQQPERAVVMGLHCATVALLILEQVARAISVGLPYYQGTRGRWHMFDAAVLAVCVLSIMLALDHFTDDQGSKWVALGTVIILRTLRSTTLFRLFLDREQPVTSDADQQKSVARAVNFATTEGTSGSGPPASGLGAAAGLQSATGIAEQENAGLNTSDDDEAQASTLTEPVSSSGSAMPSIKAPTSSIARHRRDGSAFPLSSIQASRAATFSAHPSVRMAPGPQRPGGSPGGLGSGSSGSSSSMQARAQSGPVPRARAQSMGEGSRHVRTPAAADTELLSFLATFQPGYALQAQVEPALVRTRIDASGVPVDALPEVDSGLTPNGLPAVAVPDMLESVPSLVPHVALSVSASSGSSEDGSVAAELPAEGTEPGVISVQGVSPAARVSFADTVPSRSSKGEPGPLIADAAATPWPGARPPPSTPAGEEALHAWASQPAMTLDHTPAQSAAWAAEEFSRAGMEPPHDEHLVAALQRLHSAGPRDSSAGMLGSRTRSGSTGTAGRASSLPLTRPRAASSGNASTLLGLQSVRQAPGLPELGRSSSGRRPLRRGSVPPATPAGVLQLSRARNSTRPSWQDLPPGIESMPTRAERSRAGVRTLHSENMEPAMLLATPRVPELGQQLSSSQDSAPIEVARTRHMNLGSVPLMERGEVRSPRIFAQRSGSTQSDFGSTWGLPTEAGSRASSAGGQRSLSDLRRLLSTRHGSAAEALAIASHTDATPPSTPAARQRQRET